jgi:class 3 adenylate cyclase
MDATEKRVVIVMADISGYTQFMVENQTTAVHGQQCITYLMEALIHEIDIPLRLQEIEGDALFLYAEDPGSEQGWAQVLEQIPAKLPRFFNSFYKHVVLANDSTPCGCAICRNGEKLALKIIVHTGTAVFHKIGGVDKVSGPDVILAHRLLKNSVPDKEYLLMSESAYRSIGSHMEGEFLSGRENYEKLGKVNTYVRYNDDIKQYQRELLYRLPRLVLLARVGAYVVDTLAGMFPAMIRQSRAPVVETSRWRRLRFAVRMIVRSPLIIIEYVIGAPRRLFKNRSARMPARSNDSGSL